VNKKHFFNPGNFVSNTSESINYFLKNYRRAALINIWLITEKCQCIFMFLEGIALIFYDIVLNAFRYTKINSSIWKKI